MKIYAVRTENFTMQQREELLTLLDSERKKKVERIKHEKEKIRSIYAGLLLRYAFIHEGHDVKEWTDIKVLTGEHGKPYFKGIEDFQYSLSHSGDWIVCAVDKYPVGFDIQQIGTLKMNMAKRFYAESEYEKLVGIENEIERTRQFYCMWAAKESLAKLTGIGIGFGVSQYITDESYKQIYDMDTDNKSAIKIYGTIEGYIVCGCTDDGIFPDSIEIVEGEKIMQP